MKNSTMPSWPKFYTTEKERIRAKMLSMYGVDMNDLGDKAAFLRQASLDGHIAKIHASLWKEWIEWFKCVLGRGEDPGQYAWDSLEAIDKKLAAHYRAKTTTEGKVT